MQVGRVEFGLIKLSEHASYNWVPWAYHVACGCYLFEWGLWYGTWLSQDCHDRCVNEEVEYEVN